MTTPEDLIRRYVDATSAADREAAAALTADDAVIELPDGRVLEGKEGARQFAAKHVEADGRKQSVSTSLDARTPDRFVATLVMSNREVATDERWQRVRGARRANCAPPGLPFARGGRCRGGLRSFRSLGRPAVARRLRKPLLLRAMTSTGITGSGASPAEPLSASAHGAGNGRVASLGSA